MIMLSLALLSAPKPAAPLAALPAARAAIPALSPALPTLSAAPANALPSLRDALPAAHAEEYPGADAGRWRTRFDGAAASPAPVAAAAEPLSSRTLNPGEDIRLNVAGPRGSGERLVTGRVMRVEARSIELSEPGAFQPTWVRHDEVRRGSVERLTAAPLPAVEEGQAVRTMRLTGQYGADDPSYEEQAQIMLWRGVRHLSRASASPLLWYAEDRRLIDAPTRARNRLLLALGDEYSSTMRAMVLANLRVIHRFGVSGWLARAGTTPLKDWTVKLGPEPDLFAKIVDGADMVSYRVTWQAGDPNEPQAQRMLWRGARYLKEHGVPAEAWGQNVRYNGSGTYELEKNGLADERLRAMAAYMLRPGETVPDGLLSAVYRDLRYIHHYGLSAWSAEASAGGARPMIRWTIRFDE